MDNKRVKILSFLSDTGTFDSNTRLLYEINILITLSLLFIFRTAIPELKYPFIVLFSTFSVFFVFSNRFTLLKQFYIYIIKFKLIFILYLVYAISVFFSNKLFLLTLVDLFNWTIILLIFFMLYTTLSRSKEKIDFFIKKLIIQILFFCLFISIINIIIFFELSFLSTLLSYIFDKEEVIDYNYASVPMLMGIISVLFFLKIKRSLFDVLLLNFALFLYSINIFILGSRRGFFILITIIFILLFLIVINYLLKKRVFSLILKQIKFYFFFLFFFFFILFIFFSKASFHQKNETLKLLGVKNTQLVKSKISSKLHRVYSIFDNNLSYIDFNNIIWSAHYDPREPETWKNTRNHRIVYPLSGLNVEIVPKRAKGYLQDSTSNPSYYPSIDLLESYTPIVTLNVKKGERYYASVFCYVSSDFDISTASLSVGSFEIMNNIVFGRATAYYSLENKNKWQKLEIDFQSNEGQISIFLSFTKNNEKDLRNQPGYIIFAYPQCLIYENEDNLLNLLSEKHSQEQYESLHKSSISYYNKAYFNLIHYINSFDYKIYGELKGDDKPEYSIINTSSLINSFNLFRVLQKKDLKTYFKEDTTYYELKSNIEIHSIDNDFLDTRKQRWIFAGKIYRYEYNLIQKIFGGGFKFLNWYGFYFYNDKTKSDYPHNPLLYVLLYSGMVGLCLYLLLMYKILLIWKKSFKYHPIIFIYFFITYLFTFFSGCHPFDPPMMGFFIMLPLFIDLFDESKGKG